MTSADRPQADLTTGPAAEYTGLSVHALRYYEREGLFAAPVRRDGAGHRVYSEWDLEWLEVCTKLRSAPLRNLSTSMRHRFAGFTGWWPPCSGAG
jgi:DNA-binding transcriptional MerR regulator